MLERNPPSANLGATGSLVPPLFQTSVFTIPDLDTLDRIIDGAEPGFIYARDAHPNSRRLGAILADLESAKWGLVTGSGMGALSAIFLTMLSSGDRVVASSRLYGRTTQLLKQELSRYGVRTALVDTSDLDAVRESLKEPTRLVLVETLSNPLLRVADLSALAEICHASNARLVVDNTFATPILVRPLELGADLVMESITKMIGGHSDVTLGLVCGRDDLLPEMTQIISMWGLSANPFDCWLAERGLSTLSLRIRAASANAAVLADWLVGQPGVAGVAYPGRIDHPDRALAHRLLGPYPGNMLCFDLAGGREAINAFLRRAPGIPFSPSLGDTRTTLSYPAGTSHRYVSPAERERQGISDGLIRLSVGVEEVAQIQEELRRGLMP
jgi:cystathionine gamma-synthase